MGKDDFGSDIGGVRLVDKIATRDFTDKFIRVASLELNLQLVVSVDIANADHAAIEFNEEVTVAFFPTAGEVEFVAKDDLTFVVNMDRDSEAFAEYFCHASVKSVFGTFFKKKRSRSVNVWRLESVYGMDGA